MKIAFLVCIAFAFIAASANAQQSTQSQRRAWTNELLTKHRSLMKEFWTKWAALENTYFKKIFAVQKNATLTSSKRPAVALRKAALKNSKLVKKSNLPVNGEKKLSANLGALKKQADAKRILAIKAALAKRNGTVTAPRNGTKLRAAFAKGSFLAAKRNGTVLLGANRNKLVGARRNGKLLLAPRGNGTFVLLPRRNSTLKAANRNQTLKFASLKGSKVGVKGVPLVGNRTLTSFKGNMTDAQLAKRRSEVLAKFAAFKNLRALKANATTVKK